MGVSGSNVRVNIKQWLNSDTLQLHNSWSVWPWKHKLTDSGQCGVWIMLNTVIARWVLLLFLVSSIKGKTRANFSTHIVSMMASKCHNSFKCIRVVSQLFTQFWAWTHNRPTVRSSPNVWRHTSRLVNNARYRPDRMLPDVPIDLAIISHWDSRSTHTYIIPN